MDFLVFFQFFFFFFLSEKHESVFCGILELDPTLVDGIKKSEVKVSVGHNNPD